MAYWPLFRHFVLPWFVLILIGPLACYVAWNWEFEAGTWSGDRFEDEKTLKAIWTLDVKGDGEYSEEAVLTAPDERQWTAVNDGVDAPWFSFDLTSKDPEYEELLYDEITAEWNRETDCFKVKVPEYTRITLHRTKRDTDYFAFITRSVILSAIGYLFAFTYFLPTREKSES
jgi:hypothetical protein